jgi:hypothetical protein
MDAQTSFDEYKRKAKAALKEYVKTKESVRHLRDRIQILEDQKNILEWKVTCAAVPVFNFLMHLSSLHDYDTDTYDSDSECLRAEDDDSKTVVPSLYFCDEDEMDQDDFDVEDDEETDRERMNDDVNERGWITLIRRVSES